MTLVRRLLRASHRHGRSLSRRHGALALPYAVAAFAMSAIVPVGKASAQRGQSPVAPGSSIGPATDASTFSVLGLASVPEGGTQLAQRNELWLGATQPLGGFGRVKLSAIGSGNWRVRDAVGANSAVEGIVSLRARARVRNLRTWSAVSYGHVDVNGAPGGGLLPGQTAVAGGGFDGTRADTTVSSRVDIGNIGRAEAGLITNMSGVELSFGFSVERATRVTTQTLTIDVNGGGPPSSMLAEREITTRTVRGLQRRDIATGIAAMAFNTGSAAWLVSVTSPVATWITSDALSPKPRVSPTVASLAVVQPLATWLSVVGAASTNSASVGTTILRDDIAGRRGSFSPVLALGFRIARLPFGGRNDDTPHGILSFETRMIGGVDSAMVTQADPQRNAIHDQSDTLRVQLLIDAPRAETVEIMGDATQWVVTGMQRNRNGRWRAELKLTPGMHRITVRADGGRWMAPPGLPVSNDDYGSPAGMIIVKGKQ